MVLNRPLWLASLAYSTQHTLNKVMHEHEATHWGNNTNFVGGATIDDILILVFNLGPKALGSRGHEVLPKVKR